MNVLAMKPWRPCTHTTRSSNSRKDENFADKEQVSRKTFVDNVARQVIERHILRHLSNVFSPESVCSYGEAEMERIATETPELSRRRRELKETRNCLEKSLRELRE